MKRYVLAGLAILLAAAPERAVASSGATVSISTSGGVTFPAANPSTQPVTPASTAPVSVTLPHTLMIRESTARAAISR